MPPGYVCNGCNNYFGRSVEEPVLRQELGMLRSLMGLPTKARAPARLAGRGFTIESKIAAGGHRTVNICLSPNDPTSELTWSDLPDNRFAITRTISNYDSAVTSAFLSKIIVELVRMFVHCRIVSGSDIGGWDVERHRINARYRQKPGDPYVVCPYTPARELDITFGSSPIFGGHPAVTLNLHRRFFYAPLTDQGLKVAMTLEPRPPFTRWPHA